MAEKYFQRKEAEELLPFIGHCLEEARTFKQRVEELEMELARAVARVMVLGGSIPPLEDLSGKKAAREKSTARLQEEINRIHETGCVVKDVDEGLVDFLSLREGKEVYLCWKLGEERIGYWHGIEEGFTGRKPLDEPPPEPSDHKPSRVQ